MLALTRRVGEEIVIDGSESFDEDGEIVNYAWDFGAPAAAAARQFPPVLPEAGDDIGEPIFSYIYTEPGTDGCRAPGAMSSSWGSPPRFCECQI